MASIAYYLYTQLGLAGGPEYGKLAPLTAANSHAHLFLKASWEKPDHLVEHFGDVLRDMLEACHKHGAYMM